MNLEAIQKFIKLALQRRQSISNLSIYRLFDGISDGVSDLYIDYYDGAILAHYLPKTLTAEKLLPQIEEALKIYSESFSGVAIYIRVHPLDAQKYKEIGARLIVGSELNEKIIQEGALKYYINIPRSPHAGLYADMRELRHKLASQSKGRVINLFAFTGSLGLSAAVGGALEVLQIDSNPAALSWAKKNQELNQDLLAKSQIKYFCSDSLDFLKRELARVKKGMPKADLIICDPPSFGRSASGTFSFKNNAKELASLCLQVLSDEGQLIFTCNSRQYSAEMIADIINEAAKSLTYKILNPILLEPPAIDFPAKNQNSIAMRGVIVKPYAN
jgi:23S rRNA G2069 N7-methylase RlmK/C1962 C5-methylase RlmI